MSPPDASGPWPDLAGRIVHEAGGRHHVLPIRVYFEDTDFSGLVYHATYLRWCERGRSDFLRLLGNDHQALFGGAEGRAGASDGCAGGEPAVAPAFPPTVSSTASSAFTASAKLETMKPTLPAEA